MPRVSTVDEFLSMAMTSAVVALSRITRFYNICRFNIQKYALIMKGFNFRDAWYGSMQRSERRQKTNEKEQKQTAANNADGASNSCAPLENE